jgi:hypothetical protein
MKIEFYGSSLIQLEQLLAILSTLGAAAPMEMSA